MYGRGVQELLEALPQLSGLDSEQAVRRLLSGAWLELAETRELGVAAEPRPELAARLRRLALALQAHTYLAPDLTDENVRAAAFVAAEALDIARDYGPEDLPASERIVVGLLYLIAGYDANAAVVARGLEPGVDLPAAHRYALTAIIAFLTGTVVPLPPPQQQPELLHDRVRELLWREIGDRVSGFTRWLRDPRVDDGDDRAQLAKLADLVQPAENDPLTLSNADINHLLGLLIRAIGAAAARALRNVDPPPETPALFMEFLVGRCRTQPLLWPAAAGYAQHALPGPSRSAVVAVPTGAGKSAVADLAIQHAATRGWVLYLAPTNALVSQIRRQLRADHPGITIREFFGGAEYTALDGETLQNLTPGQVFVMTPEKCSLALRQSPGEFETMSLCILDEAHLLADTHGRGQLTELVLSEVLARAPSGQVLLMSALIANPDSLATWLADSHGRDTIVVREPWRPTRTLRAVIGVDSKTLQDAAEPAAQTLAPLPTRRRNVPFEAPLAALAGLYGPWSTGDESDYALVGVAATIPISVTRPRGGGEISIAVSDVTVRPTVEALAQLLGGRGQKVIAFLPRSRHDSFAAATSMPGFGPIELSADIEALLELAAAELGLPSLLAGPLAKGVGVHTSALLPEERRATELAFETDLSRVLFATGTLAQGLNLPATTVIIGGTDIGYDPDQSGDERRSRERAQLLNAIGRAGRARVSARSLALVVPTRLPVFDEQTPASRILSGAEFLAEEDASTNVLSALRPLLQRLLAGDATLEDIHPSDHIALSYLAPAHEDAELSHVVLHGTWAAHQLRIREQLDQVARSLDELTTAAVSAGNAPRWAAEAARRAAVPIPVAAGLAAFIQASNFADETPTTIAAWAEMLVHALVTLSAETIQLTLDPDAFASTAIKDIASTNTTRRMSSFTALRASLAAWLSGEPLADVGAAIHGTERLTNPGRGQQDPIPRTIRTIEQGLGFGITRAAGALAAVIDVSIETGDSAPLPVESQATLELLPVALRYGAVGHALAFVRAGARPRAVAHLLARVIPEPLDGRAADELQIWAGGEIRKLAESLPDVSISDAETQLLEAFLRAREVR
jgi:hypothetical protein